MAAGHDHIRDAMRAARRCLFLQGSRDRTFEHLKQRFSRRIGCSTLADAEALRFLSAPSGPQLPGCLRLHRFVEIYQSTSRPSSSGRTCFRSLLCTGLMSRRSACQLPPPRISPTAAASVAASGCLRQPLSGPALRDPAATLPVSAPARPFRRDCLAALSAKAFPGGLSGRHQRDARHLAGSPLRFRCRKEELARVSELPARVSRFECLCGQVRRL